MNSRINKLYNGNIEVILSASCYKRIILEGIFLLSGVFFLLMLMYKFLTLSLGFLLFALTIFPLISVFSRTLYFGLKGLTSNKPYLVVNDDGILDNTSITSPGFIEWKDISKVKTNGRYIGLEVSDKNKAYKGLSLDIKAMIYLSNVIASNYYPGDVNIPTFHIADNAQEIFEAIEAKREIFKCKQIY